MNRQRTTFLPLQRLSAKTWPNLYDQTGAPIESPAFRSLRVATVRHYISLNNRKRRQRGKPINAPAEFNFSTATAAKRRAHLSATLAERNAVRNSLDDFLEAFPEFRSHPDFCIASEYAFLTKSNSEALTKKLKRLQKKHDCNI